MITEEELSPRGLVLNMTESDWLFICEHSIRVGTPVESILSGAVNQEIWRLRREWEQINA